jgi:elongation factor G
VFASALPSWPALYTTAAFQQGFPKNLAWRELRAPIQGNSTMTKALSTTTRLRNVGISAHIDSGKTTLLESLAFLDDGMMEIVGSGQQPPVSELKRALRAATLARTLTPVLMASAYKNKGVQPVLDAIRDFLPDPSERRVYANDSSQTHEDEPQSRVLLQTDVDAPTVVMAFKTVVEKFGQLTFLRVYQGRLERGDTLKNVRTGKAVRFGRLVRVHSDKREDIENAQAGDIVAVVGIDCASGDTFAGKGCNVQLENIVVAAPVIRLSIVPEEREDLDRLSKSLDRFRREDPTFHVVSDSESGETHIAGMGQLHLEVYAERLRDECKCPCILGHPSVTYKERPTVIVDFQHRFKKQNGGQGQFAQIAGRLEPLPPDAEEAFVFEDQITGGRLLRQYIAAVRDGVCDALTSGPLDGYEMVGVKLTLTDGDQHDKDSSEWAFRLCAAEAMRAVVLPQCGAELLEPIMQLEVEIPSEFQGNVTGHLARLRGAVNASEVNGPTCTIQASAPLAELFD